MKETDEYYRVVWLYAVDEADVLAISSTLLLVKCGISVTVMYLVFLM